jgi:hypothetical protein
MEPLFNLAKCFLTKACSFVWVKNRRKHLLRKHAEPFRPAFSKVLRQLFFNPKLSLNVSVGRYYRLPPYPALGYKDASGILINKQNEIKYIGSDHVIGGIEYSPNEKTIFTLEVFNKQYFNYPVSAIDSVSLATKGADFGVVGNEEIISIGEGHAYGFEILNRTKIGNKFNMI